MYQNGGKNYIIAGLLLGAVAGVAIGLMLAPRTGAETREILRERIASGAERIRRLRQGDEATVEEAEVG